MLISIIRTIILYLLIVLGIRLMGKRQISELQTSELVVTLLLSNIAAIPMQNVSIPLHSGIVPIVILIFIEIFLSIGMIKSSKFRRFICGRPLIVINDGKIDQTIMKELRISVDDLFEQLHQLSVFNISEVSFAIMEPNGKMSVLKKAVNSPVSASVLNIEVPDEGLATVIIDNGKLSDYHLGICNLSQKWVADVLKTEKIKMEDIYIMTANKAKKYTIVKKEVKI